MFIVGVREAKDRMAELINRALAGEEVRITRRGVEMVRLKPLRDEERARLRGKLQSKQATTIITDVGGPRP